MKSGTFFFRKQTEYIAPLFCCLLNTLILISTLLVSLFNKETYAVRIRLLYFIKRETSIIIPLKVVFYKRILPFQIIIQPSFTTDLNNKHTLKIMENLRMVRMLALLSYRALSCKVWYRRERLYAWLTLTSYP